MIKLNISAELKAKLDVLCTEFDSEIGGYLTGESKAGEIYLDDILIPSQRVSSVSVKIDPKDQISLLKRYGQKCKRIIGHFHSHHRMGAFWSGQDSSDMQSVMQHKKLYVFIVGSKGDYKIRVCLRDPVTYDFEQVNLYVKTLRLEMLRTQVKNIFKQNGARMENNYFSEPDMIEEDEEETKNELAN